MPRRNGDGIALLADPTRRDIVAVLATRPTQPSPLATRLGLSRPAVSRQLRLLAEAGLVVAHPWVPDGRCVAYTLDVRNQGRIIAWLAGTEIGLLPSDSRMSAPASRLADHDADGSAAPSATHSATHGPRRAADSD